MNKLLLLFLIVFGLSTNGFAQKTISGQILDKETNDPLPRVDVNIKDIDENTMNVALSIGAVPHPDLYTFPTLMFHLSFESN